MENWLELSETENEKVWTKVYGELRFKPSISDFSPFDLPTPFLTYYISNYFGGSEDLDAYDDLEEKTLIVFQENTSK